VKDGYVMCCTFETVEDFQAVDPLTMLNQKLIAELKLPKEQTKQLLSDLQYYRKCLSAQQQTQLDTPFLRNFIGSLLQALKC